MLECPKCHAENREDSRFCSNCAAPLGKQGFEPGSLTKTQETPVRVLKPGTLISGKYKIIDEVNFIRRVKVPTLMLNGRYDTINRVETTIQPMMDLLGTSAEDKKLMLYETDHIPPVNEMIKETLAWLDKYLGPVRRD